MKTLLLVMHGEDDPQVPPAILLFPQKLCASIINYLLLHLTRGASWFQPAHRLDAWEKELAFLQQYINPKYWTTTTSTEEVVFPGSDKQANANNEDR